MPIYNGALYVRDALQSIFNQTVRPQEIIISDSGSSDGSEDIVREEARRSQTNVTILPTKTPGMVANWNSTIRAASGKYIKFLFQDDLLHSECLQEMVKVAESDRRIGFVFSSRELIVEPSAQGDSLTKWLQKYHNLSAAFGELKASQPGSLLLRSQKLLEEPFNKIGEPTAVLIRTSVLREAGPFREEMCQLVDMEMWVRLMAISHVGYISKPLVSVRIHPGQASNRQTTEEIGRFELNRLGDTLRSPMIYPLLNWRVRRALSRAQRSSHGLLTSRVKRLVRRLKDVVWIILPNSLRLRLHYFRRYQDYLWFRRHAAQCGEDSLFTLNTVPLLDHPAASEGSNPLLAYFNAHKEGPGIHKWMHYFDIYQRHFQKFVGREVHVLEVGIYAGGSLSMWREYFGEKCHVYGVDIDAACMAYSNEKTKIFIGDQADRAFWANFKKGVPPLDLLIDDGGHLPEQQRITLEEMLPHIRPGGVYVCEDIHGDNNEFAAYIYGLANGLNSAKPVEMPKDTAGLAFAVSELQKTVHSVHLYPFLAVIEKRERRLDLLIAPMHGSQWPE